jgi:cytoskeleton protein RodZ
VSQASVGAALAEARVAAGLTLDDVARITRIRTALLRAIEADDLRPCGGTVYAKGHIRAYAAAVGADARPLVAQLETTVRELPVAEILATQSPLGAPDELLRGRGGPPWMGVGVVAAAIVTVLAVGSFLTGGTTRGPEPARAAPLVVPTTAPATAGPVAVPTGQSPPTEPALSSGVNVTVQVKDASSWIGLYAPGSKTLSFQGVLAPGTRKEFTAATAVSLRIGKPEAVEIFVNGRSVGSPGKAGQPTDVTYGPSGATTTPAG